MVLFEKDCPNPLIRNNIKPYFISLAGILYHIGEEGVDFLNL
jgi:hypothetical protein